MINRNFNIFFPCRVFKRLEERENYSSTLNKDIDFYLFTFIGPELSMWESVETLLSE